MRYSPAIILVCALIALSPVSADTPADCRYEHAIGTWLFHIGDFAHKCTKDMKFHSYLKLQLTYPQLAIDESGRTGFWTLIYNQGFEVTHNHRKWLVNFAYDAEDGSFNCSRSMPGWTHDALVRQWNCSYAVKLADVARSSRLGSLAFAAEPGHVQALRQLEGNLADRSEYTALANPRVFSTRLQSASNLDAVYRPDPDFVRAINRKQSSWWATDYAQHSRYTLRQHVLRSGAKPGSAPFPGPLGSAPPGVSAELKPLVNALPDSFDWRQPPGGKPSPLTDIRDQGACGSCYAFASTGAAEARIRLQSRFAETPLLSPQDVVDCSPYSEGCSGGFPYLIAGKYAEDRGLLVEACAPYNGTETGHCPAPAHHIKPGCRRYYATNYRYIGGYYGATNAELMQLELMHNGPFPVGFNVYPDFRQYESGVYVHTGLKGEANKFDPFVLTNHAVVLVGFGVDAASGLPYWSVRNSWGPQWGEAGYFRIRRGVNECGVESLGVAFDPML